MSAVVTCPSCAAECPDGSRFCLSCGAALTPPPSHAVERKIVTTVFCDLVGFTALCEEIDSEDVDNLLREFYGVARRTIETWGGVVEKFVGDAVVGVFGVPTTHEDDPERAVMTAIRLLERLPESEQLAGRRLEARVGINTGAAVVRLDVAPGSGEGFLVGDAVNTSARLQKLAPPMGIVVGEKTRDLTSRSIVYERLQPATVKGKRGAVRHWLVRGPVSRMGVDLRQEFPAPLVGREVELGILRGLLKKVRASSQPQFALVVGEAGIGKSRLMFEFLRYIDSRPAMVRWRQGRCPAYGDGLTFWPLGEIVKEQLGVSDSDDVAAIEVKLSRTLAGEDDSEWLAARLRPLLGLESSPASRAENFAAWQRFLEIVAGDSPAVVVFEDLHWASEATLAFFRFLVENAAGVPLLVVGTSRPDLFHTGAGTAAGLSDVAVARRVVRVDLAPLSESETQELFAKVGHGLADFRETRQTITQRSGGNPLFVEQLVRHLEGERSIAGPAVADDALQERAAAALPETLQSLIAARLDDLPPAHKSLLSDAAVIGEVFWVGAVAALDHGDRAAAEKGLRRLAERDLVRAKRDSSIAGEGEFAFSHALIRDVAYEQLARSDRVGKHAAVARWVEGTAGDRADEFAEILAHHYVTALELAAAVGDDGLRSELQESAIRALKLAGDRALPLDVRAAERHYAKAVDLAGEGTRRPYVLVDWAKALLQSGRLEEAVDALDEGVRGLRALGDDRAAKAASAPSWEPHWLLADGQVPPVDETAELGDDDDLSPERVTELEYRANRAVHVGHSRLAIELAERALAVSSELHLPESPSALMCRGMAACALGEAAGLDDLTHALRLAQARGVGHTTCAILANLGEFLTLFEGPESGLRVHREGLELAQQHHDELAICFCREVLFVDLVWSGQWGAALAEAGDLDGFLGERNDLWDLQLLRSTAALVQAWRGEAARAREQATWAEKRSRATPLVAIRAACLISLASVQAADGDEAAARRLLRACRSLASAACVPDFALRVPEAIRLAMRLGEPRLAQRFARGLPATRPYDVGTFAVLDALLRERRGEHGAAAVQFAAAEDQWARLGVPYEAGQAALGRGRCLAALGQTAEAAAALTVARDALAALGAQPALAEATALLEALAG